MSTYITNLCQHLQINLLCHLDSSLSNKFLELLFFFVKFFGESRVERSLGEHEGKTDEVRVDAVHFGQGVFHIRKQRVSEILADH